MPGHRTPKALLTTSYSRGSLYGDCCVSAGGSPVGITLLHRKGGAGRAEPFESLWVTCARRAHWIGGPSQGSGPRAGSLPNLAGGLAALRIGMP